MRVQPSLRHPSSTMKPPQKSTSTMLRFLRFAGGNVGVDSSSAVFEPTVLLFPARRKPGELWGQTRKRMRDFSITHELIINHPALWTLLRCIWDANTMNQNAGKACEISRWIYFELRTHHKFHMEPILLYQRFQQTLKPMSWVMHIPHSHSRQHPGLLGDKLLLNFITPVVEYRI